MLWVIFFFICGIVLILLEFIMPGGICGAIGGLLIIISTVLGCYSYPEYAFFIITGEAIGTACGVFLGVYVLARSGAVNFLRLNTEQKAEEGWVDTPSDLSLIGKSGTVLTALRPAGIILVDNQRINAVSDSHFIDKDAPVTIIEVHGNRIVVEPVETEE